MQFISAQLHSVQLESARLGAVVKAVLRGFVREDLLGKKKDLP